MGASAPEARHSGQAGHCRAFCSRKPRSQPGNALPALSRPPNKPPAIPLFPFLSLALPDRNAYKNVGFGLKEGIMKKFLIGLVILLVVVGAILVAVFLLTGGVTKSADAFFTLIRDGKAKDAYLSASREFQASASEDAFATFLKDSSIADYESATWSSRSVTNNIGELEGSIKTRAGAVVPIKIKLVKEDGRWKIHAIEKAAAGLVKTPAETRPPETPSGDATVPPEDELKAMTSASIQLLARAIKAKDFTEFHQATAKIWQNQVTPESLMESFKSYIEQGADLTIVKDMTPEFQEKPSIDEKGILVLKGAYPTRPSILNFTIKYIRQDSEWKLVGIFVNSEDPAGGATPKAEKHEIPPEDQQVLLANRSMTLLAEAVSRDDFDDFYGSIAKFWQQQITKDKLRERLSVFIEKKISLTVIEGVSPIFSEKASIDNEGLLVLKGRYPTKPYEVEFELDYYYEDSEWKLFGFNVNTRYPK
jgi:hypothetical protein